MRTQSKLMLVLLATASAGPALAADAATGQRLFQDYGCYACHGTTGAGGGIAGPKLAPDPLPYEAILAKLRTASGRMPVYSPAVLPDSEIADIAAYLQSIPRGRPATEIPLLRPQANTAPTR
jgi:mono/diheme cytochrome c family protein